MNLLVKDYFNSLARDGRYAKSAVVSTTQYAGHTPVVKIFVNEILQTTATIKAEVKVEKNRATEMGSRNQS